MIHSQNEEFQAQQKNLNDRSFLLLDVRQREEFDSCNILGGNISFDFED